MLKFMLTMGGLEVFVNGEPFGHIQRGKGFFISFCVIREPITVSPADLREIADKAERAMRNEMLSPS